MIAPNVPQAGGIRQGCTLEARAVWRVDVQRPHGRCQRRRQGHARQPVAAPLALLNVLQLKDWPERLVDTLVLQCVDAHVLRPHVDLLGLKGRWCASGELKARVRSSFVVGVSGLPWEAANLMPSRDAEPQQL